MTSGLVCPYVQCDHPISSQSSQNRFVLFFLRPSFRSSDPLACFKIPRHDDWDVNEAYQRIGGGVLLESSCLVLLCRTVDQVIAGGKGTSTFMRNSLDVCFGAVLGLNVDKRRSGWRSK